jgi:hypothetical protein
MAGFNLRTTFRMIRGRGYSKFHLKTSTRIIIFSSLIVIFIGLIDLTGAQFRLIDPHGGPGIDIRIIAWFIFGDYLACFCSGPFIGPMDPYPFRSACAFIGGLLMVVISLIKVVFLR